MAGVVVAMSLAGGSAMAQQAGADRPQEKPAGPIKVFILAGQSNMEGHGVVSMDGEKDYNGGKGNLVWSMEHSKSAAKMKCLKNGKGEWVVRNDVRVSYKVADKVREGGLTVGYTCYGGGSHIGPELGFGLVMGDYFKEPVLLIKTAWGGKSLFVDFRPPSSGGQVGPFYTRMVEEVRAALAALGDQPFEIAGFGGAWLHPGVSPLGWRVLGGSRAGMTCVPRMPYPSMRKISSTWSRTSARSSNRRICRWWSVSLAMEDR